MKTSNQGRKFIESFEGLILQSYDDANDRIIQAGDTAHGTLTIGYGHTSAAGAPTVHAGQKITKEQADSILASDLVKVENDVNRLVKVKLNQNQFDALVSFHFNTGSLGRSSTLRLLNQGKYAEAADALMLYTKGRVNGQLVPMRGLVRRREGEKAMFLKKSIVSTITPSKETTKQGGILASFAAFVAGTYQFANDHWIALTLGALTIGVVYYTIKQFKKEKDVK